MLLLVLGRVHLVSIRDSIFETRRIIEKKLFFLFFLNLLLFIYIFSHQKIKVLRSLKDLFFKRAYLIVYFVLSDFQIYSLDL
jgi:hypothetical protein